MTPHQPHPLILTALLDPASQARFEEERQAYFPPALNFIAAHVTLFHHLPGAELATIDRQLGECCRAGAAAPFSTTGLRFMGRGTAYLLSMPAISGLRASLAERWRPWLTPQDRQGWQAHVTVQNKVAPDVARRLHASLKHASVNAMEWFLAWICGTTSGVHGKKWHSTHFLTQLLEIRRCSLYHYELNRTVVP